MNAFITGSQVYGKPTKSSDIDLVVLVDPETEKLLLELSNSKKFPIRYGRLNLITCTNEEEYAAWMLAKHRCLNECTAHQTRLTKEKCCKLHDDVA